MEFKVIFAGFALHCVLNAVLIGKTVFTGDSEEINEALVQQQEESMLRQLASSEGSMKRVSVDAPHRETKRKSYTQ